MLVDRSQLVRVFFHLLDNAIHYSNAETRVHVSYEANERTVTLRVQDNGSGMSQRDQDRAFQVFGLLTPNDRKEVPIGIGAGLPICKRIIERNGGNIWIESTLGHGTSVYFTPTRRRVS